MSVAIIVPHCEAYLYYCPYFSTGFFFSKVEKNRNVQASLRLFRHILIFNANKSISKISAKNRNFLNSFGLAL